MKGVRMEGLGGEGRGGFIFHLLNYRHILNGLNASKARET